MFSWQKEVAIEKPKTEEGEEEMDVFQKRRRSRRLSTQAWVSLVLYLY